MEEKYTKFSLYLLIFGRPASLPGLGMSSDGRKFGSENWIFVFSVDGKPRLVAPSVLAFGCCRRDGASVSRRT